MFDVIGENDFHSDNYAGSIILKFYGSIYIVGNKFTISVCIRRRFLWWWQNKHSLIAKSFALTPGANNMQFLFKDKLLFPEKIHAWNSIVQNFSVYVKLSEDEEMQGQNVYKTVYKRKLFGFSFFCIEIQWIVESIKHYHS